MERAHKIIVILGALACLLLFFADVYIGAIGAVIVGVLLMVFLISEDASNLPDLTAYLTENTKSIIIKNRGNATAYNISVSLVPLNREFTLASLDAEATFEHAFGTMIGEVKSVVRYED
jgi:hypothetical protein